MWYIEIGRKLQPLSSAFWMNLLFKSCYALGAKLWHLPIQNKVHIIAKSNTKPSVAIFQKL
jgi:hypothetical protein